MAPGNAKPAHFTEIAIKYLGIQRLESKHHFFSKLVYVAMQDYGHNANVFQKCLHMYAYLMFRVIRIIYIL